MITETLRSPGVAFASMHMVTVICVLLLTVKLVTVMPVPKLTDVTPERLVPVSTTVIGHCPCVPLAGLTSVMAGLTIIMGGGIAS